MKDKEQPRVKEIRKQYVVKANDPPGTEYEIDVKELCEACNIEYTEGGFYFREIKTDIINLTQRYWVELPDKTISTVS